jgi:hypothetical protein
LIEIKNISNERIEIISLIDPGGRLKNIPLRRVLEPGQSEAQLGYEPGVRYQIRVLPEKDPLRRRAPA